MGRRESLAVFGNDYPTEDGTGVRDYIHVMDLADGHVVAMEKLADKSGVHIYNLGAGVGSSVWMWSTPLVKPAVNPLITTSRRVATAISRRIGRMPAKPIAS